MPSLTHHTMSTPETDLEPEIVSMVEMLKYSLLTPLSLNQTSTFFTYHNSSDQPSRAMRLHALLAILSPNATLILAIPTFATASSIALTTNNGMQLSFPEEATSTLQPNPLSSTKISSSFDQNRPERAKSPWGHIATLCLWSFSMLSTLILFCPGLYGSRRGWAIRWFLPRACESRHNIAIGDDETLVEERMRQGEMDWV